MDVFVARQPIFDVNQNVFGYELLFRSGLTNMFQHHDPNEATSRVIVDSFLLLGMQELTGGKRAFINITKDILLNEYLLMIPKDLIVVEILETIEPDPKVIAACQKLKKAGYMLAMDDFVDGEKFRPLVELADFIKVDFLSTPETEQRSLVRKFSDFGVRFLAEKVETNAVHQGAMEMGYTFFQGYFFSKPKIFSGKEIPGYKIHYLQLLQEIHRPELDFDQVVQIIRREMSLSFKLLRYINSVFFNLRNKVTSLMQAVVLLGEREIRKWVSLIALARMGEDKPEELMVQAMIRAKFCESLTSFSGLSNRKEDLFLMGMFSLLDAILDRPLNEILKEIPISEDIKIALAGEKNRLNDVYQCGLAWEVGDWEKGLEFSHRIGIDESTTYQLYLQAVKWGHQCFQQGL